MNKKQELLPGQLYLDKDHKFHCEQHLQFAYLLLSKDREDDYGGVELWKCAVFMEIEFGAYMRFLSDEEVHQLHYIGHIKEIVKEER